MNTYTITNRTEGRRNAPNPHSRLSILVDVAQAAADDARAVGLHQLAGEIDAIRQRATGLAMDTWRGEGWGR